jgi:arabinose-5-phosphate isomerase
MFRAHVYHFEREMDAMENAVRAAVKFLSEFSGTVYITGIGKSWHVARKCVATWQSLGLAAQPLLIQDMAHGDMGVLKEGDVIVYLSNSGNTEEIVNVAKYIKNRIGVRQLAMTAKTPCDLASQTDLTISISKLKIDEKFPIISPLLFMAVLDQVGVELANSRGFTMDKFKVWHPGGDLGRLKS